MLGDVLLDKEDCFLFEKFKYRIVRSGKNQYVARSEKIFTGKHGHRTRLLHRDVMGQPPFKGAQVDHINGNGLDNRRCNLRWVDSRQNHQNESKRRGCTSIFKGVCFEKFHGKFRASIKHPDGRKISLGLFVSERDAAIAYDVAARLLFKEYARTNNIFEKK